jgi:uracil-DNA glycosylase
VRSKKSPDIINIIEELEQKYPNATYELHWENPLQLLIATILASQCTDERVNQVTPALFKKYPTAQAFAAADRTELEELVKSTGFYRVKAESIQETCKALVANFRGEVPHTMDELITLPRVARKTANVVLNIAMKIPSGIIIDSHGFRVCRRLGLTTQKKPEKVEAELMERVGQEHWIQFGAALVLHGRYTCTNTNPHCGACMFEDSCPKIDVETSAASKPKEKAVAKKRSTREETPDMFASVDSTPALIPPELPASWRQALAEEFSKPYFAKLQRFVTEERASHQVFPPDPDVFNAFRLTPYDQVRVLLLGQDPYHDDGQAHGLCFSVRPGIKIPASLRNIFLELKSDLGCTIPNNGYLVPWAEQGILLLNTVLTVRAHQAASHKDQGWELFTDAVIRKVQEKPEPVVFVLWGGHAQKKAKLITGPQHIIIQSGHPSPLSVAKFFGTKPFSKINDALKKNGAAPIDWQLPNL